MTMYPEILKKGQAEVDAVIGNDRLPTMKDRDALPYVNAICMELLRWNVLVPWSTCFYFRTRAFLTQIKCPPLALHVNTQDIMYEGYLIPKGSWIVPNIWFVAGLMVDLRSHSHETLGVGLCYPIR